MVSVQLLPEENCPPVRIEVWVKVRVSFKVGGNQKIAPEENSTMVTVRVWVRVILGLGAIFLGSNCRRTVPDT